MTDDLVVDPEKDGPSSKFPLHPAGTFAGIVAEVVSLGTRVSKFAGRADRLQSRIAIIVRTTETRQDGQPFELALRLTKSLAEKATLRRVLAGLLGRSLGAREKFDLRTIVGKPCMVSVTHDSYDGKTFANIASLAPLMKGATHPGLVGYVRAPYWATVIAEYAAETAGFEAAALARTPEAPDDTDDDLPF